MAAKKSGNKAAGGEVQSAEPAQAGKPLSPQEELEKVKAELAELKAKKDRLDIRVSEKKAVSLYGLSRFPATFYAAQWLRILDNAGQIRQFIKDHEKELAWKAERTETEVEKLK